ncbi:tryptophan synthase subunit alpha, partial [Pseudomonas syringae group genomosp. 7]|uniref:tryptophan synthase subunit alpha n=1 Tax=Pseudomonas syringae group genomosp. 7 TaxID=251699 RepID=UPI00376FEAF5
MSLLEHRLALLKTDGRAALVTFITAGYTGFDTSVKVLKGLAAAGADVIVLGMPLTDPMADGVA